MDIFKNVQNRKAEKSFEKRLRFSVCDHFPAKNILKVEKLVSIFFFRFCGPFFGIATFG